MFGVYNQIKIAQESALDFYPVNIGDERHYYRYTYDYSSEDTIEVHPIRIEKVVGDTVLSNGKKYFIFRRFANNSEFLTYRRIDTASLKVFEYVGSLGCNAELDIFDLSVQSNTNWKDCLDYEHISETDTSLVNGFGFDAPKIIDAYVPFGVYISTLVKGVGRTILEEGDLGKHNIEYLVYAKIGGKEIGTPTGIKLADEELPISFQLMQNYPNPFNPTTTINYFITEQSHVVLTVYDILGCEVINLVNEIKSTGLHSVEFDSGNLSSGIYFYNLKADSFIDTKKMILMR